jgi:hypothetical protein
VDALVGLLMSLAVVAVAGGGMAAIVGLTPIRDRLLAVAVALIVAALTVPIVVGVVRGAAPVFHNVNPPAEGVGAGEGSCGIGVSPVLIALILLGHLVLGAVLVRRRLGGRDGARNEERELEEARGRRRPRLPEDAEEIEP